MEQSIRALIATSDGALASEVAQSLALDFHWRPVAAPTFRVALAEIRNSTFDLVLIDRDLDGGDGIVFAPIVKKRNPRCRTLLLSSHNRWATHDAATTLGFDAVLGRHYPVQELAELLVEQSRMRAVPSHPLLATLTVRELEILNDLATGLTNHEIAQLRGISEATTKSHLSSIYRKLRARNRVEAISLLRS